jgi:DNA-binding MarR family transcriptional regulator
MTAITHGSSRDACKMLRDNFGEMAEDSREEGTDWSLMTARGLALLFIAHHPGCTKKELAASLKIGGRATSKIIAQLKAADAVRSSNHSGRRLHYEINPAAPLQTTRGVRTLAAIFS